MPLRVIVGASPVGSAVARELLANSEKVRMVTRSGSCVDGSDKVAADAGHAERLSELSDGAAAIYNCVKPPYHRWATDWPPVANALLAAAAEDVRCSGAIRRYTRSNGPSRMRWQLRRHGTDGFARPQHTRLTYGYVLFTLMVG